MSGNDFLRAVVVLKDGKSTVSLESPDKDRVKEFLAEFADQGKTDPPAETQELTSPPTYSISDMECALAGFDDWGGCSIMLADRITHDSVGHMKAHGKNVSLKFPKMPQPFMDDIQGFFDTRRRYSLTITRIEE